MDLDGRQARLDAVPTARDRHRHHTPKNLVMRLDVDLGEVADPETDRNEHRFPTGTQPRTVADTGPATPGER